MSSIRREFSGLQLFKIFLPYEDMLHKSIIVNSKVNSEDMSCVI